MKKLIIQVAFVSSVLLMGSCKKQLELRPSDNIDISKAFQTVSDLEKGLLGVYSANSYTNKIYASALLSDELKLSDKNLGQGQFTFKFQFSATGGEHNAAFGQYYVALDRLHRVLDAFDGVTATTQADIDKKARIRAELIALRGIAHYELLIRFMPPGYDPNALGVAIMLRSDITAQPARNTVGQVVAQIEQDLAAARAEASLPNAPTDVLRLCKATVAGYQARVSALKRDWNAATTFASDAITLSGKDLASPIQYSAYWQDANEVETLWKFRNNATPQTLFTGTGGIVYFEPSIKLKNQYDRTNDVRFMVFFGSRPADGDTSIITKYPGSALGPQINDLKLMRIAEMYLLRAEAYAENNQLTQAAADINKVRAARIPGYTNVTFPTKQEAVDAAINERFKELCFEGFRFFTLKRKNLPVTRLAVDVQSTLWQTLPVGDYRFALPIPQDEIFANPNAVQNPGY